MCHPIQECRRHFGITKNTHPFRELQISGDDNTGCFVQLADQVKQQGTQGGIILCSYFDQIEFPS